MIAGAHQGAGLGTQFLRHVERTRILVHLIDASQIDPENPLNAYDTVNNELTLHSEKLSRKPQLLVLNKMDLPGTEEAAKTFQAECTDKKVMLISAVTRKGVDPLKSQIVELLDRFNDDVQKIEL